MKWEEDNDCMATQRSPIDTSSSGSMISAH